MSDFELMDYKQIESRLFAAAGADQYRTLVPYLIIRVQVFINT